MNGTGTFNLTGGGAFNIGTSLISDESGTAESAPRHIAFYPRIHA